MSQRVSTNLYRAQRSVVAAEARVTRAAQAFVANDNVENKAALAAACGELNTHRRVLVDVTRIEKRKARRRG
jgi:hypothetical protein